MRSIVRGFEYSFGVPGQDYGEMQGWVLQEGEIVYCYLGGEAGGGDVRWRDEGEF